MSVCFALCVFLALNCAPITQVNRPSDYTFCKDPFVYTRYDMFSFHLQCIIVTKQLNVAWVTLSRAFSVLHQPVIQKQNISRLKKGAGC